jgi:hypothetical protein
MNQDLIKIGTSVIKAGVAIIPWAGGPISSIIGDISQERYNIRLEEFIERLNNSLSNQIDKIDKSKISKDDFKDIFVNILNDVLKNRNKEKRTALTNILINTITNYNISFDESEYLSDLINRLSVKHLLLLNEIYNVKIPSQKEKEVAVNIVDKVVKNYSLLEHDVLEKVHDLENEYLVRGLSNNYNMGKNKGMGGILYADLKTYITTKGIHLLKIININE